MKRILVLLNLLLLSTVSAQETAEGVLDSMASHLKSLDSFSVHMEKTFDDVMFDGAKIQFSGAADLSVRQPDRLYMVYGDEFTSKELWYDAKTFTLHDDLKNVYMQVDAEPNLRDALTKIRNRYNIHLPIMSLIRGNPAENYGAAIKLRRYIGIHDVEGIPCHHVLFRSEEIDWQLWIQDGDTPLLRKYIVTYKQLEGAPQDVVVLTDWELNPKLKDKLFEAKVPEDAVLAEVLVRDEVQNDDNS